MLKISIEVVADEVLLILEGRLSGPWVAEVESTWRHASANRDAKRISVNLSGVTFISEEGQWLLERICATGIEMFSSDLLTKTLCEELSKKHRKT